MKKILDDLISHRTLERAAAQDVLTALATGKGNPSQMSAILTVFMMRPITIDELEGFRDAMLSLCLPVKMDHDVMDVCGTGGDGKNTFNISTLSAFVVAACGQPVAKHGNYGVSSVSGSSNVLEYFGYKFTSDTDALRRSLDRSGIFFMHAPLFHPAMKHVAPVRKELGVRTFFNMLGPMVNPAQPRNQLVGVFNLELARQYAYLYQQAGKRFTILHDLQGYDEISLTGLAKLYTDKGEQLLGPDEFGFDAETARALQGGSTVKEAAEIFLRILEGEGTPTQNRVVSANAALALQTAKQIPLAQGIQLAEEALKSRSALRVFESLLEVSQETKR